MNSRCQCRLSGPVDTILGCHRDPISSEKCWLDYAVRELSREAAGKARGQEAVWKKEPDWFKAVCPHDWKNPTANPKDSKEVLKCKFECLVKRLRELDQVPEEMREEIELWESGKVAELFLLTSFSSALGHTSSVHSILSDAQRRMQDTRSGVNSVILDHLGSCLTACLDTVNALKPVKGMSSRQDRESSSQKHSDCRQSIPESSAQKNISLPASSTQKEMNFPPDLSELSQIRSNHKRKIDESYSDDSAQASPGSKSKKHCRASVSSFSPSLASPSTCSPSLPSPSTSPISPSSSTVSPSSSTVSPSSSTVSPSSSTISPSSSTISPSSFAVSFSSSLVSPSPPHNNSLNPEQAQLVLALFQQQTFSVTPEVSNIQKVSSAPISSTLTAGLNKTAIKPDIVQPSADQTLPTQHFITASSDLSKKDNFPDFLELELDLKEVDELEGVDDSKSFDSMLSNFPLVDSKVSNLAFMSADSTNLCGLENIPSADPFLHEDSPLSKTASCEASPYSEKSSEVEGRERLGSGTSPHSSVRCDTFIDLGYSSETSTSHRSSVDSDYDLRTPDALEALVL